MITPTRGRKLQSLIAIILDIKLFTDDNPDKGTETLYLLQSPLPFPCLFADDNPDKGTETSSKSICLGKVQ